MMRNMIFLIKHIGNNDIMLSVRRLSAPNIPGTGQVADSMAP